MRLSAHNLFCTLLRKRIKMPLTFKTSRGGIAEADISCGSVSNNKRSRAVGSSCAPMDTLKNVMLETKQRSKPDNKPKTVVRNKGIESRVARDSYCRTESNTEGDEDPRERKVWAALSAKAEIYAQITQGTIDAGRDNLLIDVEKRRKLDDEVKRIATPFSNEESTVAPKSSGQKNQEIEIVDCFGRTRLVATDSQQYRDYLRQNISQQHWETEKLLGPQGKWAWSKGKSEDESFNLTESGAETFTNKLSFEQLVQDRINQEVASQQLKKDKSNMAPWELVLLSSSRSHLDEVHKEAMAARAAAGKIESGPGHEIDGSAYVFAHDHARE